MSTFKDAKSLEDLITKTAGDFEEEDDDIDLGPKKERRFRASIYVDIHVPETGDLEADRDKAKQTAEALVQYLSENSDPELSFSNPYVGGVKHNPFGSLSGELSDSDW